MTSPAFSTATVPLVSGTGAIVQVKVAVLPDGSAVPAHAFVDSSSTLLDPAKDTTVQAATAAIIAATALLGSKS